MRTNRFWAPEASSRGGVGSGAAAAEDGGVFYFFFPRRCCGFPSAVCSEFSTPRNHNVAVWYDTKIADGDGEGEGGWGGGRGAGGALFSPAFPTAAGRLTPLGFQSATLF